MKVKYGKVRQLQFIDAIVGELPKLRSQATATALVSMFAESGGMGAAATLAGVNGFPGYYIHFYIDDIEFYAAFTGIFFNEGESIYVVYDEGVKQNFNVLAIMNKNNHLLGMVVPFGHTVAMSNKAHNKTALTMGVLTALIGSIVSFFLEVKEIYIYVYIVIFSMVVMLLIGRNIGKQFRGYAEESERIYKILGVTDLTSLEKTGMQAYIDPNNRMYDDVYNYTQFLDYDPQPLVDVRTDESHLR
ncbi:putative type VI secretion system effector [Acinetobacter higginsii]|uniref:putative type VI secretion system effector n=1 Tax=Acinetobacter higginsii TaxID=70347 RepID=UPI001F606D7E|nr:putative type VI secretion system effector [Acinetobacter higginsii]MCI3880998.1 transposase [Acinetobacter higginsii]MDO3663202.1 putative type VI secretion system effector [Acinetobacter higginsii]